MKDDLNNNLFEYFDFNKSYIGLVLDNSDFLTYNKIKVFIPELFGSMYTDSLEAYEFDESISKTKLEEFNNLIISDKIELANYIECYPKIYNSISYEEDYKNSYCPKVRSFVKVSFNNGNPLEPYYSNTRIVKEGEALDLKDGSSNKKIIEGEYYTSNNLNIGDLILDRTNKNYSLKKNNYQLILTESGNYKKNTKIVFPKPPEIEGYDFIKWDPDIDEVNDELFNSMIENNTLNNGITFTPIYEKKTYDIVFLDIDNRILKEINVEYGTNLNNIEIPDPGLGRKVFSSWDNDLSFITKDMRVIPIFDVSVYLIKFMDNLGNTIKKVKYRKGEQIIYPEVPNIDNYDFIKWDMVVDLALKDTIITAIYKENSLPLIFKDNTGNIIKKYRNDSIISLGGGSGGGNSGIWKTQTEPPSDETGEIDIWMYEISSLDELEEL